MIQMKPLCGWLPCKPRVVDGHCTLCSRPVEQCEEERSRPYPIAFQAKVISTWCVYYAPDGTQYMQKPQYCVLNDHTLGYTYPKQPQHFGVLAADIHGHNPMTGIVILTLTDTIREATLADFHRFRVDPTGHLDGIRRAERGDIFPTHCGTTHD